MRFDQVANLANAVAFSHAIGHPLTVHITVVWSHVTGFRESLLSEMTNSLRDRLGRWLLRHHKVALRAVWTRERGHNKGHHLHMLANIPVRLVPRLKSYLVSAFNMRPKALEITNPRYGMKAPRLQMQTLKYLCKSLDHTAFVYRSFETVNVGDMLGIEHRGMDGVIQCKRAGTTESIGRTARRRAGWKEARSIEDVAYLLNPAKALSAG